MPENYERALIEADRQRIEEARNEGKSALPSLIGSSVEEQEPVSLELEIKAPEIVRPNVEIKKEVKPIAIPEPVKKEPPKLERPTITKAETSAPSPVVVPQTTVVRPAEPQLVERPQPVLNERLYEAYSRQMGQIVANMTAPAGSPNTAYFYTPPPTPQVAPTEVPAINGSSASRSATPVTAESALSSLGGASDEAAPQDGAVTEDASPVDLPLPGKILYAQMITEANSDQPGPIVARILQGDLAGSDLVGNFSVANNALILEFNGVSVEETMSGKPVNEFVPLRAVAVNVEHVGSGLATDVDHHMFQRVAVTFATSFISGMGNAIAMSGTVTQEDVDGNVSTTNPTLTTAQQALVATGQAAGATSGILGELYGNRPTTVKVASGTPIGVLFLQ
jgi:intracellular multiplication protein IcmE